MNISKALLSLISLLQFSSVFSGEIKTNNPERHRDNNKAMTEITYKKFVKLQKMIADKNYASSRKGLEKLSNKRLNSFEKANINQYIGWIELAEGDYINASNHFQKVIDSDSLPNKAHFSIMLKQAFLLIELGTYQKGIVALNKYYKVTDVIQDETFALEARAFIELKQYDKAIDLLKKAIKLSETPQENWNFALYNLYSQTSQPSKAAKTLETLRQINPSNKAYINSL